MLKAIEGYEGLYEVSEAGEIWSRRRERWMQKIPNTGGYLRICLCYKNIKKYFYIHRLVASAFIDNPNQFIEVNHKNSVRYDNRIENLEWVTQEQNRIHAQKFGRSRGGYNNKVTTEQVKEIRMRWTKGERQVDLGKEFGLTQAAISLMMTRKNWHSVH